MGSLPPDTGALRAYTFGSDGVGALGLITKPLRARWHMLALRIRATTGPAVANRYLVIVGAVAGLQSFRIISPIPQTASLSWDYWAFAGLSIPAYFFATDQVYLPAPADLYLTDPSGAYAVFSGATGDEEFTSKEIVTQEWIEP